MNANRVSCITNAHDVSRLRSDQMPDVLDSKIEVRYESGEPTT
jgi:hypothetical protein